MMCVGLTLKLLGPAHVGSAQCVNLQLVRGFVNAHERQLKAASSNHSLSKLLRKEIIFNF